MNWFTTSIRICRAEMKAKSTDC